MESQDASGTLAFIPTEITIEPGVLALEPRSVTAVPKSVRPGCLVVLRWFEGSLHDRASPVCDSWQLGRRASPGR